MQPPPAPPRLLLTGVRREGLLRMAAGGALLASAAGSLLVSWSDLHGAFVIATFYLPVALLFGLWHVTIGTSMYVAAAHRLRKERARLPEARLID